MKNEIKNSNPFKEELKKSWSSHKALWIIGIVLIVVLIAIVSFSLAMRSPYGTQKFYSMIVSNKLECETVDGEKIVFYYENNPDYNGEKIEVIEPETVAQMYKFYYFDENGEKVYLDGAIYEYKDSKGKERKMVPFTSGLIQTYSKYLKVQKVFKVVGWIVFAAVLIGLIVLWYIKDKQYQERQKSNARRQKSKKQQD